MEPSFFSEDRVEHTFFANSEIVDEAGTRTPGYVMVKPFTRFIGFLFHILLHRKAAVQAYISQSLFISVNESMTLLVDLTRTETQRELSLICQLHVQ
jgi:hypothetical protein